jgi:heavy metal translocating P-type ATPase
MVGIMGKISKSDKNSGDLPPLTLLVEDLSCASCVGRVEKALKAVAGVERANVNLATGKASVWGGEQLELQALINASTAAGYPAKAIESKKVATDGDEGEESRKLKRLVVFAGLLTLPIFLLDMGSHFIPAWHDFLSSRIGMQNLYYVYFVLASIVQFGPGLRFYLKGWPALMRGAPDMNSLVMLGTSAAWGFSVVATFGSSMLPEGTANVYFEASAVIVTLVLLGRHLESIARGRTSSAIRKLLSLQAKTARVIRDGEEFEIGIDEVKAGELIRVRPGERIALDGEVDEGESYIDEAMISGEPVPVRKKPGDQVIGGTINQKGSLRFRVTRIGDDTVLAQIIRMVEEAQAGKLPIQALVDKVTGYFVPAVMVAAALTFLVWFFMGPDPALTFALVNAVAVLIIACPCAMGLATPTSIMVGTGKAAENGILFRRGDALQQLRDAEVIALDKTGTLTIGKPALTDFELEAGQDRLAVLQWVASAEKRSEHPIGQAIVDAALAEDLELIEAQGFNSHSGLGIEAKVEGRHLQIGSVDYMAECGLEINPLATHAKRYSSEGKSILFAAVDGKCVAVMAVADTLKKSAAKAVQRFRDKGLKVVMITGDNEQTARSIAGKLGIDEVVAGVRPDGKVDALKKLKSGGRKVIFVGDGINDAPALAAADVGIAIGSGTDIAMESAEVVLMSDDLGNVARAITLSRATIRNIQENLFWAFAYNTCLIPVAAGVLYPAFGILLSPVFAAMAMAVSSICVLANSLRLKRLRLG